MRELVIFLVCLLAAVPAVAEQVRQVVILNSYDPHAQHNAVVADAFRTELERHFDGDVSFTEMNLDARWDVEAREPLLAELLRERQKHLPLDLIFAEGPAAITFWLRYRDSIAPGVAMVATARKGTFQPEELRAGDAAVWSDFSFRPAIQDILTVQPDTRRVLIVLGSSEMERALTRQAERELAAYQDIEFAYANDFSLGDLQEAVQALEPPAAVYLAIFNTDVDGAILRGHSALSMARLHTPVPIFGPFDDQLGLGIVGGRLIPLRRNGELVAAAAAEILRGEAPTHPWQILALTPPTFDWRELQRWSIDPDRLPADSDIRYEPMPIWERYPVRSRIVLGFIVAQTLLIGALLAQWRRARNAERSQTRLAGMLIDAHETERRRIARELHDDVSQRLASLAIEAGLLSRGVADEPARGRVERLEAGLGRVTEDLHDLSYRLHPSIVDDLGIVTALHTECEQVQRGSEAAIVDDIQPLSSACPRDTALCLYRICQEALGNAVRHAGAHTIEVRLRQSGSAVTLEVRDDGCGFDPAGARGGLGLSSMTERCRLLQGSLSVDSVAGRGTHIRATLPLGGPDPDSGPVSAAPVGAAG